MPLGMWTLVPQPGIEPVTLTLEAQSLNHWITREIPQLFHLEREREVAQSCPTLCDPMDCSLPGSTVHGIFQAIVLEWIAISFSKGSSQPRDRTRVSCILGKMTPHLLLRILSLRMN